MLLGYLLSTSVNFLCGREIFRQLLVQTGDFTSTSINFPCCQKTVRQLSSTFCVAVRPSVNFRQLSVRLEDCPSTCIAARIPSVHSRRPSVWLGDLPLTFNNFLCCPETFRQLPSTLRTTRRYSLNFINFCVGKRSSITFPCG